MGAHDILLEVNGPVAFVRFNRPDLGNAVTADSAAALHFALTAVDRDESIRVVVLTGTGSTFNVGAHRPRVDADVAAVAPTASTPGEAADRYARQIPTMRGVIELLHTSSTVSIAAVNGACAGAGLALALATDLRYAATSAGFNTAFLSAGFPGELGAIWFAARLVGLSRARELFLLPGRSTADRMAEIGLINGVYAVDQLLPSVTDIAERIAACKPTAVQAMKANFAASTSQSLAEYLDFETAAMVRTIRSEGTQQ